MILLALGLLLSSTIPWVRAQGTQLTRVNCTSSPREGGTFRVSFKLSGTPVASASRQVSFFKNGEGNGPFCSVDRFDPCSATASCGCSETGGERTFHYSVNFATASLVDGDWTAVLQAFNPADTVTSPICRAAVNSGKASHFRDGATWLSVICVAVTVLFT